MIKAHKSQLILTSIVTLLPILIGLILWNQLPDPMVTHWDGNGVPNGYSSKLFAVFGLPLFLLMIHWLCVIITSADPKKSALNTKLVAIVLWICPVVSLFCGMAIYAEALGFSLRVERCCQIFIGTLFIILGNYLPKCEQNYTVGIKLPWTMHSTENWNRTHRFAGPVWVLGGAVMILSVFGNFMVTTMIVVLAVTLLPTVYSYWYYKKYEQNS